MSKEVGNVYTRWMHTRSLSILIKRKRKKEEKIKKEGEEGERRERNPNEEEEKRVLDPLRNYDERFF